MADLNEYLEQLKEFDINNVDWDRVGVWPLPGRILVFVLTVVAIFVGCYMLMVKSVNTQLEAATVKESSLKRKFEQTAFDAANLDRYRQLMAEMNDSFGALISRLPSDTEVPGLIEDIDDKGIESRLSIESIDLQGEQATEFHIELPIKIVITGGYHEFGAFVSGVAGMPRIVTLHDFSITNHKDQAGLLRMEILAKTYRYKDPNE